MCGREYADASALLLTCQSYCLYHRSKAPSCPQPHWQRVHLLLQLACMMCQSPTAAGVGLVPAMYNKHKDKNTGTVLLTSRMVTDRIHAYDALVDICQLQACRAVASCPFPNLVEVWASRYNAEYC